MAGRPFKPPLLRKLVPPTSASDLGASQPFKKQKLSHGNVEGDTAFPLESDGPVVHPVKAAIPRKPLLKVLNPPASSGDARVATDESYHSVLWRKFTLKKHKNWDGDGVLSVRGGYAKLQDVSGKDLGSITYNNTEPVQEGTQLKIGGRDVEIVETVSKADFLAGRSFSDGAYVPSLSIVDKPYQKPTQTDSAEVLRRVPLPIPRSAGFGQSYKNPLLNKTTVPKGDGIEPTPRHDPKAEKALVMKRPKSASAGRKIVDVVVDPYLGDKLRPHQREGVAFLYECVMGMRDAGEGAILADDMGLGKTLQTITLLWTLLKQNPIYGSPGVIKKALIVCPVTLIKNWKKEFKKWLGNERIGVFIADEAKVNLRDFTMGKSYSVMIIGYERLRLVQEELIKGAGVDIVIADEGHRLKTAKNKSAQAILSLNTDKRVVLSGTPIQNDLSEFYVMVNFVNPGTLPTYNTFKRTFEVPIIKSRQPDASKGDVELGQARAEELGRLTSNFIIRRSADVLAKYLPAKTETVLFCKPTTTQVEIYQAVLGSSIYNTVIGSAEASFQLISALKKVCNSPSLLRNRDTKDTESKVDALIARIPPDLLRSSPSASSGKLLVLQRLLLHLRNDTDEKIVLVSNYTSTLDLLQSHLESNNWRFLRLDGSTPQSKRQDLVDTFNRTPAQKHFAFLLSAKAGGVGLNLIGASRLVLYDVDWNPTTDLQAMARIHRDGQTREVRVYRLLTAGGLDEKIYQRQLTKQGLADEVMDKKASASSFTKEELRDLFRLDTSSVCRTHDLLECNCGGRGSRLVPEEDRVDPAIVDDENSDDDLTVGRLVPASKVNMDAQERRLKERKAKQSSMQTLMKFAHFDPAILASECGEERSEASELLGDEVLFKILREKDDRISYIFTKTTS
ncbi:MAG: helicase [Vezdaea aestivalis]|nr:MAG: helicase [Vezdaea aestivalis]